MSYWFPIGSLAILESSATLLRLRVNSARGFGSLEGGLRGWCSAGGRWSSIAARMSPSFQVRRRCRFWLAGAAASGSPPVPLFVASGLPPSLPVSYLTLPPEPPRIFPPPNPEPPPSSPPLNPCPKFTPLPPQKNLPHISPTSPQAQFHLHSYPSKRSPNLPLTQFQKNHQKPLIFLSSTHLSLSPPKPISYYYTLNTKDGFEVVEAGLHLTVKREPVTWIVGVGIEEAELNVAGN